MAKRPPVKRKRPREAALEDEPDLDQAVVPPKTTPRMWTPSRIAKVVAMYLVGACLGYLAYRAHFPLPWMLGALTASIPATLIFRTPTPPRILRMSGQVVVGTGVGLYLNPDALQRILESTVPILAACFLTTAAALILTVLQVRLAGVKPQTAFFACIPGSPVEMAHLSEKHKGDPAQVALAQILRIVLIVTLFPPLLLLTGMDFDPFTPPLKEVSAPGLIGLLVCAGCAGYAGFRLRATNPYFLMPMMLAGILTAVGVNLSGIPNPLIACAQIFLGASLGAMFRRDLFENVYGSILTFVSSAILIVSALGVSLLLAFFGSADFATLALAVAPGGVTEMTLSAKAMHLDVSLVAAYHLTRVFIVTAFVPLIFALVLKMLGKRREKTSR
jgi:membrane AbrB-like protein